MRDKETGHIDPLAGIILDSFRALELDEHSRKILALQIKADRTKAQELIDSAKEVSKEIIPPIPTMTPDVILDRQCFQLFGLPVKEAQEEINPLDQSELYATPIGPIDANDWTTARNRSIAFRKYLDRISLAVQATDGKIIGTIGKSLYSVNVLLSFHDSLHI